MNCWHNVEYYGILYLLPPYGGMKGEYGMKYWKQHIVKTFYFIALTTIIVFSMTTCDNGDDNSSSNNDNYREGTYSGFTVTSTLNGQITFQVWQVNANFTTNIPNNTSFSLGIEQPIKNISGLTPNRIYDFSFTYNANIHISLQVDNGRVYVGRGWY